MASRRRTTNGKASSQIGVNLDADQDDTDDASHQHDAMEVARGITRDERTNTPAFTPALWTTGGALQTTKLLTQTLSPI